MPRIPPLASRGLLLLLAGLLLASCGGLTESAATRATTLPRVFKPGKLAQAPVAAKWAGLGGQSDEGGASRELRVLVTALRTVLSNRPGAYAQSSATVLDNASLAAQNANPDYGQLLQRWGRLTGYFAAFDLDSTDGQAGLLRASVIISVYREASGARAAYLYVVEQQARTARRFDFRPQSGVRLPWDEAVVFYQEATNNGRTFGQYTLIFRTSRLIGFVTNVGLADAVSRQDTLELTQAVITQLATLQ